MIRTPDHRLRVFISSTLGELADERLAARAAVEQLRLTPVMFELGARPHPPRALYRSYLEQSDVFVGIYWERYGWVAPDMEISGLEDEYALSTGMPRLVYVKRPADLEPRLAELLERVQAEDTTSYKPFRDAAELGRLILDDLAILLTERFHTPGESETDASARPRTNLPMQTSTFIGRETVLAQLDELLEAGVRLLTLTGAGGTGKTRLALRLGAGRVDRFADGVFFVDVSMERDPSGVFDAIARTLPIGPTGDTPPLEALGRELRGAQMLLVLDGCDHVVAAASGLDDLLQQCPDLTILVTSRVTLKVRSEQLFPVPPLSLPHDVVRPVAASAALQSEAVRLFVERVRAVRPEFALTEENVGDVTAICQRLDGLPLAIELAAGRANLFAIDELRARLEQCLDILHGKAHDLPERQRTLRNTLEWSRQLLTPAESRMLALFSVFSGARLSDVEDAARRSLELENLDVVEELGSLIDKSLVRSVHGAGGRPRFSMLETIRAYAVEQLDTEPVLAAAARRAHAEQYAHWAQELRRTRNIDDPGAALAQLDDELGNLRTAWAYWMEQRDVARLDDLLETLWGYYDALGDYRTTTDLATQLLDVLATQPESPGRLHDQLALEMSLARALIASQGFGAESERRIQAVLAQSRGAPGDEKRFPALRCLASLHIMRADFESSTAVASELLAVAAKEDDPSLLSEAHLVTGVNRFRMGGLDEALDHVCKSVEYEDESTAGFVRFRVGPHPKVVANTVKGLLLWLTGSPDRARSQMDRTLALAIELDHPYSTCYGLFHAGFLDLWRQDLIALATHADQLLATADEHDYPIWRALGLVLRGAVWVASGDTDAGLLDIDRGFTLYQGLPTPPVFWPYLLMIRATTSAFAGRLDDARSYINAADDVTDDSDPLWSEIAIAKGDLLLAIQPPDVATAERLFERAAQRSAEAGARMAQLQAATRLARLRRGTPREAEARESLQQLLDSFTEGFTTPHVVTATRALES